ncbi:SseB family protein [Geotalea sp. SG265]|uniref:SseB family protein n=1 Tax=Geotalea sp. SG265 TaxID=2922867 RepID=UPI001FAEAADA|nr:SseB family protein [Geotalea sp. SG265]
MTDLDQALETLRQNMNDPKNQSRFYDLFLNASFHVPTFREEGEDDGEEQGQALPLVMESEGNDYLMLFDSRERLLAWTGKEIPSVEVPGHVLAAMSQPPLHWALNVGTEFSKQFLPDEIAWLREVVEHCNAEAAKEEKTQGD